MNSGNSDKTKQVIAALAVLVVVVLIVIGTKVLGSKDGSPQTENTSMTASGSSDVSSSTSNDSKTTYKDGTYEATGSYVSPGGTQSIKVSVTLKNNVVTDTEAQSGAVDSESSEFQGKFIGGYKQLVVGKSLNDISVSRVSGSSLTSQGFNDAIERIKSEAKS